MDSSGRAPDVLLSELEPASASSSPPRRAMCIDLGCSENMLDGSLVRHYLKRNRWELTDEVADADLIVLNSCGFNQENERRSLDTYRALAASKRPGARLIFAGCLPAMNKQAILDAGYDDLFVTPRTLALLDTVTQPEIPLAAVEDSGCIPFRSDGIGASFTFRYDGVQLALKRVAETLTAVPALPVPRWLWQFLHLPDRETEFVRISVGCLNRCAFCVIPRAKGATRSVPMDTVLAEVRAALAAGKRHLALSCDEFASYGQDLGTDVATLLERITALPEKFHLILRNVHPEWILKYWEALAPSFGRGKVGYTIIPVQSGSDKMLRLMRRNHTAAQYRGLIDRIRAAAPGTILRTHFIVGFPGETEQDFRDTCAFARDLPVDSFQVHEYSDREKTTSARMTDKVPGPEIHRRAQILRRLERTSFLRPNRWLPLRP